MCSPSAGGGTEEDFAIASGNIFATIPNDTAVSATAANDADLQLLEGEPPIYSIDYATSQVDGAAPGPDSDPAPGTFLGARLANWVSQSVIRRGIVIVLTLTGLAMLGLSPELVGIIGAGLLILGPVIWGFIRQSRGLPPFETIPVPTPSDTRDPDNRL